MMNRLLAQRTGTNANQAHEDQIFTMTKPLKTLKAPTTALVLPGTLGALGEFTSLANSSQTATIVKQLMPYETVAKAIFVKANGLPAYNKATGAVDFTYSRQQLANRRRHTDL